MMKAMSPVKSFPSAVEIWLKAVFTMPSTPPESAELWSLLRRAL